MYVFDLRLLGRVDSTDMIGIHFSLEILAVVWCLLFAIVGGSGPKW